MERLISRHPIAAVSLALGALVVSFPSHAQRDVHFSVGIQGGYVQPAPVYPQPIYVEPAPVYVQPAPVYVEPQPVFVPPAYPPGWYRHHVRPYDHGRWNRWGPNGDLDRDGIPNRFDRDRDGDGVPNRFDRRPNNPYRY